MTEQIAETSPRFKAKIAGVFYLLTILTLFPSVFVRGRLVVRGDAAATATDILAKEPLFRLGFAADLIAVSCYIAVTGLFYDLFKPVNRSLSSLAAFFSLVGCAIGALSCLFHLAPLVVLRGAQYLSVIKVEQLQALARLFVSVQAAGYRIGLVFFGLGSTVFSYRWFKSRYIPRGLAAWGIFSSLVAAIVTLAIMVLPSLAAVVIPAYYAPIIIFEVTLGLWLLVKGIQAPIVE